MLLLKDKDSLENMLQRQYLVDIIIPIPIRYRIVRLGMLLFLVVRIHRLVQLGLLIHQLQERLLVVPVQQTHYGPPSQRLLMIQRILLR